DGGGHGLLDLGRERRGAPRGQPALRQRRVRGLAPTPPGHGGAQACAAVALSRESTTAYSSASRTALTDSRSVASQGTTGTSGSKSSTERTLASSPSSRPSARLRPTTNGTCAILRNAS